MSGVEMLGALGSAAKGVGTAAGAVGGGLNGIAKGFGEGYREMLPEMYKKMGVNGIGDGQQVTDQTVQNMGKMAIDNPTLAQHLQAGGAATSNPGYKDVSRFGSYEDLMKYIYGGA